jgi:hypothetical protein
VFAGADAVRVVARTGLLGLTFHQRVETPL